MNEPINLMDKTNKTFSKINKQGQIVNIVREHYLRDDISCQSQVCTSCKHEKPNLEAPKKSKKKEPVNYFIPSVIVVQNYYDMIEKYFKNVVFCETTTENSKNYKKIKNFVTEFHKGVVFSNQHSTKTFLEKIENEKISDYQERAILHAASWYKEHLGEKVNIIYLCIQKPENCPENVQVLTLDEYSKVWMKDLPEVLNLYQNLSSVMESKGEGTDSEYEKHISIDNLEVGVKKGKYFKGKLKMNQNNSKEGHIKSSDGNTKTIYISGRKNLNRSIHGDVVAVEVISEGDKLQGKVVGIFKRNWRDYVATINIDENRMNSEYFLCSPLDKRIPYIRLKSKQKDKIENSRLIIRINSWEADSKYPNGNYVKNLGDIGDLNTETEALLIENQIPNEPFSEDALKDLPKVTEENPFIPSSKGRKDLRKELIMSVDPIGCEDIDDALSFKELKNGNFEIGVHIADVSSFVKHDSALDIEARKRSTTIYLIDRRLDMLPTLLSTNLCSLRMGQDKYAVSVIWEFTPSGEVVKSWFGKTIINSKYALHYEQASNLMEGIETKPIYLEKKNWRSCEIKPEDKENVLKSLFGLTKFARILKKQREVVGALELQSLEEIQINLDNANKPVKIETHDDLEIHHTIAEWMIYANHCVALKIYNHFNDSALLRRHPFPSKEKFDNLIKTAKSKGFEINIESNALLAESLDKAVDKNDPNVNLLLRALATRAMSEAEYFSTGSFTKDEFYHYGLALNFYTHFTSPIRRYADIIVHRQLLLCCEDQNTLLENKKCQEMAEYMNERHRASKNVQMESNDWFAAMYFKNQKEIVEEGLIFTIKENLVSVFVPSYRLKSQMFFYDRQKKFNFPNLIEKYGSEPIIEVKDQVLMKFKDKSFKLSLFDHLPIIISTDENRCYRPSIKFSFQSLEKIENKSQKVTEKSEIHKLYKNSNETHGKKTQSAWTEKKEDKIVIEERNSLFTILEGSKESKVEKITNEMATIQIDQETDADKLKKVEKRLKAIEKIKEKMKTETLSKEEQEKLDSEEKYKKLLIKLQKKLK